MDWSDHKRHRQAADSARGSAHKHDSVCWKKFITSSQRHPGAPKLFLKKEEEEEEGGFFFPASPLLTSKLFHVRLLKSQLLPGEVQASALGKLSEREEARMKTGRRQPLQTDACQEEP